MPQRTPTPSALDAGANRLWADYARTGNPATRAALVRQFERLAYSLAHRYTRPGTANEDLFQVALMGLVKAIDRFDPGTGNRFSSFATPTILGEIRRYFRDNSWSVHVPRGMQELAFRARREARHLAETLGRAPTAAEVAASLEVPEEQAEQALGLDELNHPLSLDGEIDAPGGDRPAVLAQCLGAEDRGLASAEDRVGVGQALSHLDEPLREIIRLRYFADLSQREVARRLGVPPMRVHRMEKRALACLRQELVVA